MKHDGAGALEAFGRAIGLNAQYLEAYYARGRLYQEHGRAELATADFRKAIELHAKTFFDVVAQADAKKRLETLGKQIPCGASGNATCL